MVVDETEVVEFPIRQAGVEAFQGGPRSVTNTNGNDAKRNCRSLDDGLNCFRLLRYLAIGDDDKYVVFASLADNVHRFSDDRRQTGWTAECNASNHFVIQLQYLC